MTNDMNEVIDIEVLRLITAANDGRCELYQASNIYQLKGNILNYHIMFGENQLDQLVTVDLYTATASIIVTVGGIGLFDLACKDKMSYSYGGADSRLVVISLQNGHGSLLPTTPEKSEAISMDFDHGGVLWLLHDRKLIT